MKTRYEYLHRNKFITTEAKSIDDFIEIFEHHLELFKSWKKEGIYYLEGADSDYAIFATDNEQLGRSLQFDRIDYCEQYDACTDSDEPFCEKCLVDKV